MQLFNAFLGALALAASAVASQTPLYFTSAPTNVEEQTPVKFSWKAPSDSAVTITLMKGPTHNLQPISVITSSAVGGSYTWTPPDNLVSGTDYAFQIQQGNLQNWWGPVVLNASLEPGSGTTTSIIGSATTAPLPSATPMPPPPSNTTTPPPPPPPPPFKGAASSLTVSTACGIVFVGALAFSL